MAKIPIAEMVETRQVIYRHGTSPLGNNCFPRQTTFPRADYFSPGNFFLTLFTIVNPAVKLHLLLLS